MMILYRARDDDGLVHLVALGSRKKNPPKVGERVTMNGQGCFGDNWGGGSATLTIVDNSTPLSCMPCMLH